MILRNSEERKNLRFPDDDDLGGVLIVLGDPGDEEYLFAEDFTLLKYRFIKINNEEKQQLEESGFFAEYEQGRFFDARLSETRN